MPFRADCRFASFAFVAFSSARAAGEPFLSFTTISPGSYSGPRRGGVVCPANLSGIGWFLAAAAATPSAVDLCALPVASACVNWLGAGLTTAAYAALIPMAIAYAIAALVNCPRGRELSCIGGSPGLVLWPFSNPNHSPSRTRWSTPRRQYRGSNGPAPRRGYWAMDTAERGPVATVQIPSGVMFGSA